MNALLALLTVVGGWLLLGYGIGLTADAGPALRWTARLAALLVGSALTWCALVYASQRAILFPGTRRAAPSARPHPAGAILLDVTHPEGRSEGWLRLGRGVDAAHPGPLVIYAHGNNELVDDHLGWLAGYAERGVSVATLEYRGYGRSDGSPSQAALIEDLERFLDALCARPEINRWQIIYHGRSLGGGVLGALHARRPAAGLIFESSFARLGDLAVRFGVPGFVLRDPFDTLSALAGPPVPCLVIHGRQDGLIPFAHAERLAAACGGTLLARDCDHNDCPQDVVYWVELLGLVDRVTQPR